MGILNSDKKNACNNLGITLLLAATKLYIANKLPVVNGRLIYGFLGCVGSENISGAYVNDELIIDSNSETSISSSSGFSDLETLNYIASNPDLIIAFGTDLIEANNHYINYGISEGRETNNFNVTNYLNNYSDLSNAFGTDEEAAIRHYIINGYFEGRTYLPLSSINSVNDELIIHH